MKILMLGWELPPFNTGGLGVACYQLCKALALRGVQVDFVVPYNDKHPAIDFMRITPALPDSHAELVVAGGAYDSGGFASGATDSLRAQQARYTRAVGAIAAREHYDVIHAHDWLTFEAGMAAKEATNGPLVAHVHATEFDRAGSVAGNPVVHDIEYAMLCMADRVVAVSQATKDLMVRRYAIPPHRVAVMHNSIDTAALVPADDQANTYVYLEQMKQHGYKVVVSLGRLTLQKGLVHLLRAAQKAIAKNPRLLFLLAGIGEQYHELVALSAELGIAQNVLFTGQFVSGRAWRDVYAVGDMFVMPSISEPFGITPLEAMGYGTPVLISKQSGVGEVVHNVLRFDFWDNDWLADQILAVAAHDSLARELQLAAFDEFSKMSWHSVAEKCHDIYQQAVLQEGALV